ncbi:NB-ARC domain-containing protein [Gloeobacter violaceus]|uniref:WD-repeat protein n=1 Tax=Gloeobacter violaceus (strain ATCC 29082 / PCC 7421) TaxID=251221 RepID=Q7ND85_GLOVI|nr:NB-ARC domain-containing protein [Gloeobacter violaceus]BAC92292.1 WD-repeat protein [Gloeobacter violaceus PCC 7421]
MSDTPKARRRRGYRLTSQGWQRLHEARCRTEERENAGERLTLEDLSERTGFDPNTVAKVLKAEEGVDKQTLLRFFIAFGLELESDDYARPEAGAASSQPPREVRRDWGEAVDVSLFHGRGGELAILENWLVEERCRLVAVLGMGGIGKTALAVKLARQSEAHFERLIWRSLRNAPPLADLLAELIVFAGDEQAPALPTGIEGRILRLLECLRRNRCLLVLDNAESLLRGGEQAGTYREGCEGYGELLRRVGEVPHASCLVLTSREKPAEVAALEGSSLPVRSLRLGGLQESEGEVILQAKGLRGGADERRKLVECYRGNPLALMIISTSIRELFDGQIREFLAQDTAVFNGIANLLQQQFDRLTEAEKQLMYWLAIHREPVVATQLRENVVPAVSAPKILEALESLLRRSLIERGTTGYSQQPVVMEYTTEHFVERICDEVHKGTIGLFRSHALLLAQAKDYIRAAQSRLILKPVIDELLVRLGSQAHLEQRLAAVLAQQRDEAPLQPGYVGGNTLNMLATLQTELRHWDFSHLAVWQAYLQEVNLYGVNFSHTDLARCVFAQNFGGVFSVAFSPDGEQIAVGDDNSEIRLWRAADGQQQLSCQGHTDWVCAVAFAPNGQTFASASQDGTVKLWDARIGQCLATLRGHIGWVRSAAFAPDGSLLASAGQDSTVKLWDAATGRCLATLQGHTGVVHSVAFAPDGSLLASAGQDSTVKLWDAATGRCLATLQGHTEPIRSVVFSPDGHRLASASHDRTVKLWNPATGRCLATLAGHGDWVSAVAFAPDGRSLATGSLDRTVRLWETITGQCLKTLQEHTDQVFSIAFHPQGHTLASGSPTQTVKLWDTESGQCLRTLQGKTVTVLAVAFSPHGQTLVSGSDDRLVRLWDVRTGECTRVLRGHLRGVTTVAVAPDGRTLASAGADLSVKIWDALSGQCLRTLREHTGSIRSVAFAPDGRLLASGSQDGTAKLWDPGTGRCVATLRGHTSWIRSVAFAPDGGLLASGSQDGTARIWDTRTGECLQILAGHTYLICSVAFSLDGQLLASGSQDQTIRLWEVQTGACLRTLTEKTGMVFSLAFSPDGQILASGSNDMTVKLWQVGTGRCVKTLGPHTSLVVSIAYAPDGSTLASASLDETIRLFDPATGACLRRFTVERTYEGTDLTGATGLSDAQKAVLIALGAVERIL